MSLDTSGQQIQCDGAGCEARAAAPVALRSFLRESDPAAASTFGWLFLVSQNKSEHYCPRCAARRLDILAEPSGPH